jgi:hypothetical protein
MKMTQFGPQKPTKRSARSANIYETSQHISKGRCENKQQREGNVPFESSWPDECNQMESGRKARGRGSRTAAREGSRRIRITELLTNGDRRSIARTCGGRAAGKG